MADMIKVRSASDFTLVVNAPEIPLFKTWNSRGAVVLIPRDILFQAFYSSSLETLLRQGMLVIDDKDFLREVGLIEEGSDEPVAIELTPALEKRAISVMPLRDFEELLNKLSQCQISELAEYAIVNHSEMKMDRIEMLSKRSHKNILKAIEVYKAAQED